LLFPVSFMDKTRTQLPFRPSRSNRVSVFFTSLHYQHSSYGTSVCFRLWTCCDLALNF
jgi:hypothetical protein